jgi:hypothetical protein
MTWTERDGGWYSNGYRIERAAPFRWVLLANEPESSVSLTPDPLAIERTLSECKREAELLRAARARAELLRRNVVRLAIVLACTLLLLGASDAQNLLVVLIATILSLRSIAEIIATVFWRHSNPLNDLIYQ